MHQKNNFSRPPARTFSGLYKRFPVDIRVAFYIRSNVCALAKSSYILILSNNIRYIMNTQFHGETGEMLFDTDGQRSGEIYEIFELIRLKSVPQQQWLSIGSLERRNVRIIFNQWLLEGNEEQNPYLWVVTRLKAPLFDVRFGTDPYIGGWPCEVGRACRNYTNIDDI